MIQIQKQNFIFLFLAVSVSPEVPIVQSFISSSHNQNELSSAAPLQAPSSSTTPNHEMAVTESVQSPVMRAEPGTVSTLSLVLDKLDLY